MYVWYYYIYYVKINTHLKNCCCNSIPSDGLKSGRNPTIIRRIQRWTLLRSVETSLLLLFGMTRLTWSQSVGFSVFIRRKTGSALDPGSVKTHPQGLQVYVLLYLLYFWICVYIYIFWILRRLYTIPMPFDALETVHWPIRSTVYCSSE